MGVVWCLPREGFGGEQVGQLVGSDAEEVETPGVVQGLHCAGTWRKLCFEQIIFIDFFSDYS